MTITTEEAERLACRVVFLKDGEVQNALRSLADERDALRAENEVMQAALRRINSSITPPGEIALQAENARLREAADAAARALHKAGEQFACYANQHSAKGTTDGDQKAAINQQWAHRCFNAHDAALGEKE